MEKITRFSRPAYALKQAGVYLLVSAFVLTAISSVQAQFNCDPAVPDFTIVIDEADECIDILDVNPDGLCCPAQASGGCIELNVTIPQGVCLALLRDGEVAEGQFFVDNCLNPQSEASNITPSSPTATSINVVYCTTDDGPFDFQLCAKPCCVLDVDCPTVIAGVMECIENVPDPVTTIDEFLQFPGAAINEFCPPLSIRGELISTTNDGCPGDTIFATHVYVIKDAYDSVFCTRAYRVVDDVAPTFTVPAGIIVSCDESLEPSNTGDVMDATDNCLNGGVNIDYEDASTPGTCDNEFTITRTWTVMDDCGNSNVQTQIITVEDNEGPTFDVPADALVECQGDTTAATLGEPGNVMDNCSVNPIVRRRDVLVTSPCPMAYTVWRIWEVEDECNNITIDTQMIEVVDTVPPSYVLPANLLLDCDADTSPASTGVPTSLDDNCHMVSYTYRDEILPTVNCPANYDFFRIWTIYDECGNMVVDTQVISIRDNTPPIVVAPGDTTVSCEANLSMVNLGRLVDTSDNCSAMTIEVMDDTLAIDCPGTFTMRRRWVATDLCGNSSSDDQIITVVDTTAPSIVVPADVLIPCLGDTSPAATGFATGSDNCGAGVIVTYEDEVTPSDCAAEYTVERTWTVEDSCGLSVSGTQTIQVECIENVGLAKSVYDIDPPSSRIRGHFNATFELTLENYGNTKLTDIILEDHVRNAFGNAYEGVVPGGEPRVVFSDADTTPVINMAFDGQADIDIFEDNTGCIQPGQRVTVRFTVEVDPQAFGAPDEALNQAVVRAMGPCELPVEDLSDTGLDPIGTNPGELGDSGGSDDPTVLPLDCVGPGAPAMACNRHTNISLDQRCSLDIPASVILEGEDYECDVFYEVMITDHHGNIIPEPIPGHYKGETLHVKVIDAIFGNSCWGTVLIEDKFRPTIICENDTVYCNALDSVPPPVHFDNCDPDPELRLIRTVKEDLYCDDDYTARVTRSWQAEDEYGNKSAICDQVIMLRRVLLDSIDYPKDYTLATNCALQCNGVYPLDTAGHPSPEFTGAPSIEGIPLFPHYLHCSVSADYEDRIIDHGPCIKKIMRLWRVVEWHCGSGAIREVPQIIHIIDDQPPLISCPTVDYVTTNGGYTCEADVHLPPAEVYDSCSFNDVRVDIIYPGGILKDQNGGVVKLPFGTHQITYVAYDHCYNSSECTVEVEVADHTPPVTICDGFTTVGLNEFGEAYLYAETLDDGTYDDCYLDSFAVRRMDLGEACGNQDTLFAPFIRFCCEDVDTANVMVIFRAWDKAGNYNDCMVEVEVQDKVPPLVYCPPNITVSCDFHFDMDSLGETFGTIVQNKDDRQPITIDDPNFSADGLLLDGFVLENCMVDIQEMVIDSISQCRTGTILRGWTITDAQGLQSQCYQQITIRDFHPFDSLDITWPLDFETDVCGTDFHPDSLPSEFGRPMINDDICNLVGMEYKDEIFNFVPDPLVCYKVLRKWKIIDWCNFRMEGNATVYDSYEYEQIIKVNNSEGPVFTMDCDTAITVCTYDPDCEDGQVVLTMSASDDCTADSDLRWEYQIDAFRDGTLDDAASGVGSFVDATGFYPIGDHYVYWTFEDQCGNKTTCRQDFSVVNCKAPTAYCKNGLVVDLMPIDTNRDGTIDLGLIDVWANDLDDGSFHPCGNSVALSFSRDTNDISRRYSCDSLGIRQVTIYVTDRVTGEVSSCRTFVEVQDNQNACPRTSNIVSGRLQTEAQEYISGVTVKMSGTLNSSDVFDGAYQFDGLPVNGQFLITPEKDDHHLNGISTRDLVMLQRHLLGLYTIEGPYKLIAADADNNGSVSIGDVVEIRKLILGLHDEFPDNTSWRFVDREYVFEDPTDPLAEAFNEDYRVFDMNDDVKVDFVGLKVGDVDGNADPEGISGLSTRSDETFAVRLRTDGQRLEVVAAEDLRLSGLQMALQIEDAQHLFLVEGGLIQIEEEHLGLTDLEDGLVRISWHSMTDVDIVADDVLFTLYMESDLDISKVDVVSYPLESEVYDHELNVLPIQLESGEAGPMVEVFQNEPNPFQDLTEIGIRATAEVEAVFRVFDANGRTFIVEDMKLLPGNNILEVAHDDLGGSGVYYYQINMHETSITKKMILIE